MPSVSENCSQPGSRAGARGCRAHVEWLLSFCGDVCRGRPALETDVAGGFEACGQGLGTGSCRARSELRKASGGRGVPRPGSLARSAWCSRGLS